MAARSFLPKVPTRGLTIVELMVALTIGLIVLAATSVLFVGSSRSRTQMETSADVIENGRFAIDLLSRELSQAGFYGPLPNANISGSINAPCSTMVTDWENSFQLHVLGWNSGPTGSDADPGCITRKPGTDAIFIQRAATCAVGDAGCDAEVNTQAYVQVSECSTEYITMATTGKPYRVLPGNDAGLTLQTSACNGTKAPKRKLVRRFYYIDGTDDSLKSVDMTLAGAATPVTLVENIEQMQIEYGIATATSNGTPQVFTSTPAAADWGNVVGVRVWLLAKSSDATTGVPATTFEMGDYTGGNAISYAAATTAAKRRAYTTYIPFMTPKFRVEK